MTETSSSADPSFCSQTYKEVVVILNNDNHILMHKCLNCGFIVRNNGLIKLSHWYAYKNQLFRSLSIEFNLWFIAGKNVHESWNFGISARMRIMDVFICARCVVSKLPFQHLTSWKNITIIANKIRIEIQRIKTICNNSRRKTIQMKFNIFTKVLWAGKKLKRTPKLMPVGM